MSVHTFTCVYAVCAQDPPSPGVPQIQRLASHFGRENKSPLWDPGLCLGRGGDLQLDTS